MRATGPGVMIAPEKRERAIAMLRAGSPNRAIVSETGVGADTIKRLSHEIGIWRGAKGKLLTREEAEAQAAKRLATNAARGHTAQGRVAKGAPKADLTAPVARLRLTAEVIERRMRVMRAGSTVDSWVAEEIVRALPGSPAPQSGRSGGGKAFTEAVEAVRAVLKGDPRFFREHALWTLAEWRKPERTNGTAASNGSTPDDLDRKLTQEEESNKQRLLRFIVAKGPFATEGDLTEALHDTPEYDTGGHAMTHLLHSLRKQGKIDFRMHSNGPNGGKLIRIESTVNGRAYVRTSGVAPRQNEKVTPKAPEPSRVAEKPALPAVVAPEFPAHSLVPSASPYPYLDGLRKQVAEEGERKAKAAKFLAAAELLAEVDAAESEHLLAKAGEAEGELLGPLALEYLRYADENRKGK